MTLFDREQRGAVKTGRFATVPRPEGFLTIMGE
jgi:hypothetical protein